MLNYNILPPLVANQFNTTMSVLVGGETLF